MDEKDEIPLVLNDQPTPPPYSASCYGLPGRYCCLDENCDHPREQVFHGGGGDG